LFPQTFHVCLRFYFDFFLALNSAVLIFRYLLNTYIYIPTRVTRLEEFLPSVRLFTYNEHFNDK
jgi:hypothetical protein